ncbi:MAG: hypothetical protein IJ024_02980 [Lachnospiraceae bacterium]|nr:hypothetical protein [Lachnospiraceae bacterium]
MLTINATEVRKEWSSVVDGVVRERPVLVKRTRDKIWLSDVQTMADILNVYQFTAQKFIEEDFSITLSLNEIDLVENAATEEAAKLSLARSIMEYAVEYYEHYAVYSKAPNRKAHMPYVFKALLTDDINLLGEIILCRDGES